MMPDKDAKLSPPAKVSGTDTRQPRRAQFLRHDSAGEVDGVVEAAPGTRDDRRLLE